MSHEAFILVGLGFFAGLTLGLGVTVCVMIWLIRSLQGNAIRETISDILEEVMPSPEEDPDTSPEAEDETQEEWWKRGR